MQFFRVAAKFSLVLVSVFSVANRASAQVTWTPNDVTFTSGNTAATPPAVLSRPIPPSTVLKPFLSP